jgi:hypothetical protein
MHTLYRKLWIALLMLPALFLARPSAAQAEEMTCPTPLPVVVDVKPADAVNQIKLSARGLVPVAVLSTADFDASMFMPIMAHLNDGTEPMDCSGAAAVRWSYSDVNRDGLVDLVFFFRVQDLTLTPATTQVMLMSHGMYGSDEIHIMGMDAVIVRK